MAFNDISLAGLESEDFIVTTRRPMSRAAYRRFVETNPDFRIERTAEGEVIIMPPVHTRSGYQNNGIVFQLTAWAVRDGQGLVFDSSTGFDLPNGANRSPDASWVRKSRLEQLTEEEKAEYFPLCPDFVIELRSKSDKLSALRAKMNEYLANGAQLAWLVDTFERRVTIYRPGKPVEVLEEPECIRGDPELPGFVLNLREIWNPPF
jgi:Uma2 family endonuclease